MTCSPSSKTPEAYQKKSEVPPNEPSLDEMTRRVSRLIYQKLQNAGHNLSAKELASMAAALGELRKLQTT